MRSFPAPFAVRTVLAGPTTSCRPRAKGEDQATCDGDRLKGRRERPRRVKRAAAGNTQIPICSSSLWIRAVLASGAGFSHRLGRPRSRLRANQARPVLPCRVLRPLSGEPTILRSSSPEGNLACTNNCEGELGWQNLQLQRRTLSPRVNLGCRSRENTRCRMRTTPGMQRPAPPRWSIKEN